MAVLEIHEQYYLPSSEDLMASGQSSTSGASSFTESGSIISTRQKLVVGGLDIFQFNSGGVSYPVSWNGTTAPSLGNGTLTGSFFKMAQFVLATIQLTIGSTTTLGTGVWFFSLPIQAAQQYTAYTNIGSSTIVRIGTGVQSGDCHIAATADTIRQNVSASVGGAANSEITNNAPFVWATGDKLQLTCIYMPLSTG